jgi:DNA (cytosine-5)-methyltransferase 1
MLFDPQRPLLIDAYCGAGGAAQGYWLAGWQPVGVDHVRQPRYPFPMIVADAVMFLRALAASPRRSRIRAAHASPPCQERSRGTPDPSVHPRLIGATRAALENLGVPWVIESVPPRPGGEYLRPDLIVCGCQFGIDRIERKRHFETSWRAFDLRPGCTRHSGPVVSVLRKGARVESHRRRPDGHHDHIPHAEAAAVMGIGWMTQRELGDAIPPPYTAYVGALLMDQLFDLEAS